MITSPNLWPEYPFLPLTRGSPPEYGLLIKGGTNPLKLSAPCGYTSATHGGGLLDG